MSQNVKVCEVDTGLLAKLRKFQLRKEKNNAALVLKIEPDNLKIVLDEEHEDISIDDLREELPDHLPRYVVFSYVHHHDDGRVSYPLIFIYVSPQGCKPELQMMYAGSKTHLVHVAGFTKSRFRMTRKTKNKVITPPITEAVRKQFSQSEVKTFEVRSVEDITEEWLLQKLAFFN